MHYCDLKNTKNNELKLVDEKISKAIAFCPTELNSYFEEFIFNGSKRFRPLFIFLIADLLEFEVDEDVINLACAIELLHSASLIHDDILDDATIRHSKPCIHAVKSYKTAVLAGDYLLTLGMMFISELKNDKILKILSEMTYKMTKSEIFSLNRRGCMLSSDEYINVVKEKTSSLFEGAIKSLYEIKQKPVNNDIVDFALNFGVAFQLRDDINNFLSLDKNKVANDKEAGVCTLPVILGTIDKSLGFLDDLIIASKKLIKDYKNNETLIKLIDLLSVEEK